jgi:hypothetical protein
MSDFYTTKHKLNLAKSVISSFCGDKTALGYNNPDFKILQKMEHKYNKSQGRHYDLSDFCIRLTEIPETHYRLMVTINWLEHLSEAPVKEQAGFYQAAISDKPGITKVEHFITVDKYVQLLFIELGIKDIYKNVAA